MPRSSPHRALVLIVCLAALLLGACASADTAGGAGEEATEAATAAPDPTAPAAETETETEAAGSEAPADADATRPAPVTGTLGVEDIEGGCTTLTVDGERYELVAAPDADIVVDGGNGVIATTGGEEIARAGDTVTVEGVVDAGMMTFCQIGPVFVAERATAE